MKILFTISLFLLFTYPASAQKDDNAKPKPTPIVFRSNLLVVDELNNPIANVKRADVKVFEDGVEQRLTDFTEKNNSPVTVAFVVDNSGSMSFHFKGLTAACKTIVSGLSANDEALVVRFVDTHQIELLQTATSDKVKLNDAFETFYKAGGQSAIFDAIYVTANEMLPLKKTSPDRKFYIVLITDGEERASRYDYKQLTEVIDNSGIQILPFGLTMDLVERNRIVADSFLRDLAARTGGAAFIIGKKPKSGYMENAAKSLVYELRSNYAFSYSPINQKTDAKPRKLTVEIAPGPKGEKRKGIMQDSIVVPVDLIK